MLNKYLKKTVLILFAVILFWCFFFLFWQKYCEKEKKYNSQKAYMKEVSESQFKVN
jgi:preprotein translocase subunit YajC